MASPYHTAKSIRKSSTTVLMSEVWCSHSERSTEIHQDLGLRPFRSREAFQTPPPLFSLSDRVRAGAEATWGGGAADGAGEGAVEAVGGIGGVSSEEHVLLGGLAGQQVQLLPPAKQWGGFNHSCNQALNGPQGAEYQNKPHACHSVSWAFVPNAVEFPTLET